MTRIVLISIITFLVLISSARAQTTAYCNITAVDAQQLSNGVQVTIKADGVLEWEPEGRDWSMVYGDSPKSRIALRFTNAKSQVGKNFIDVSKFPVSYIQISIPQDAKEGVGVTMVVAMFEPSRLNIDRSNDQQSVIITVNSERTLVSRPAGAGGAGKAEVTAQMEVEYRNGLLSVRTVKTKILPLLADIAKKTGINMAVDDSVKDRDVSMALDNMPVEDVLRGIASAYGLALSKINEVYMISDGIPTDLATYHLSGTASFPMKFTKAQTASGLLPTFLYSYLHVNEAQNAVVVTAPTQMLDKIKADFTKIDLPPPQIMIEALAVEVSSTQDLDASLGLSSRVQAKDSAGNLLYDTYGNPIYVTTGSLDSATGDITYNSVGKLSTEFQARLKALVTQGKARVRANPRMAAVNGQEASIFIGQTKFIKVEITAFGGKQEQIRGVDVGVKLGVRPWTGGNGEITVTLSPEVSNISEQDRETRLPVLSTRRAETTVRVKDGETIIIGGLVQRQEYKTRRKVPLLGDIPVIGWLFQSVNTSFIDSELVIFITPHILTDRGRLQDEDQEKAIRERMLRQ